LDALLDAALKAERVRAVDAGAQWLAENRKAAIAALDLEEKPCTSEQK
jgi:hypothetical protein